MSVMIRWCYRGLIVFFTKQFSFRNQKHYQLAIFKPDRIGDLVLALSLIRSCVSRYGESNCCCIINPLNLEWFSSEFPNLKLIAVDCNSSFSVYLGYRKLLKEFCFDDLICLRIRLNFRESLILEWIGYKKIFGITPGKAYNHNPGPWVRKFDETTDVVEEKTCIELDGMTYVVSRALLKEINIIERKPSFANFVTEESGDLVISPFGTSLIRSIPLQTIRTFINFLSKKSIKKILLTGTSNNLLDLNNYQEIISSDVGSLLQVRVCIFERVSDFIEKIATSTLVLTAETATAHIACGLNKKVAVVMGGGHYGLYGPWGKSERQYWISNRVDCYGCDWKCIYERPICIDGVSGKEIARKTNYLISK